MRIWQATFKCGTCGGRTQVRGTAKVIPDGIDCGHIMERRELGDPARCDGIAMRQAPALTYSARISTM